jgi:RNase P/RNase MRP subunit p30
VDIAGCNYKVGELARTFRVWHAAKFQTAVEIYLSTLCQSELYRQINVVAFFASLVVMHAATVRGS